MISDNKYEIAVKYLSSLDRNWLEDRKLRRRIGSHLAKKIDMFPGRVYEFLDEMEGLDLSNSDEWIAFLHFLKYSL